MKNKYTKKNNRNKANEKAKAQELDAVEVDIIEENLEENLEENIVEEIIIDDATEDNDSDESLMDDIDILSEELDEDMASRLSLYDSIDDDDEEEEIKEFISRDYDVVAESRKRVNQPGRRKFEDKKKPKREKPAKEKKPKREKVAKEKVAKEKKDKKSKNPITDFVKPLWEKWLAIYNKHTMEILYGTLGALAVILLITIIVLPKDTAKDISKEPATSGQKLSQEATEESTEKQITVADLKVESEDSEIHKLVAAFIDAERIKLDIESAKTYLDDATNYSLDKYKEPKRYIEAYQNIKCYKFDYISEDMYYVYVSYDIKFINIATPAASAEPFVVKYDKTQKKYFIHNIVEGETGDLLIAWNAPEIKVLNEDVMNRYNEALAKDEDLKNFFEIMKGATNSTEQTTTAPAETTAPAN